METKRSFNPQISLYHEIMEKKYGRRRAMEILGFSPEKTYNPLKQKLCRLCGKYFRTRSYGKVYCGRQDEIGTCSNTFMQRRLVTNLETLKQTFGQQTQKTSVEAV